jgi:glycosyltransferase involved in cell wall biosynthesis
MLKFSVVIPLYNQSQFLAEAIRSVEAQTREVYEIIVVNDGSTDDPQSVLKEFPRVKIIDLPENKGVANARNVGIKEASGEVILFQDADDISLPNRVELCAEALAADDVYFVKGMLQDFYDESYSTEMIKSSGYTDSLEPTMTICTGNMAIKRSAFDRAGLFDESLKVGEDIDWETRAKVQGLKSVEIQELFIKRRLHKSNVSRTVSDARDIRSQIMLKNLREMLKKKTN